MNEKENGRLLRPFTMEELEKALKESKTNTTPAPDGFPAGFYKNLWPRIKGLIKEILDDFFSRGLSLDWLIYGVMTLVPRYKEANVIEQYRPICLLNVVYKIITKVITLRLTKVAKKVISKFQNAFIPGRNILDGCVVT